MGVEIEEGFEVFAGRRFEVEGLIKGNEGRDFGDMAEDVEFNVNRELFRLSFLSFLANLKLFL